MELVLVLALLVIMASISVPLYEGMVADQNLSEAEDMLRGRVAATRSRAINDGVAYRLSVLWGHSNWRIAPDSEDYWTGSGEGSAPVEEDQAPPLVATGTLPGGISFGGAGETPKGGAADNSAVPASDYTKAVVFYPDGTCQCYLQGGDTPEYLEITLRGPDGGHGARILRIRSLTGSVTTRRSE
jgi:hypothetical protein